MAPSASVPEPSANADSPAVDPVPEDFTAVSYTHLDVYKRQAVPGPVCLRPVLPLLEPRGGNPGSRQIQRVHLHGSGRGRSGLRLSLIHILTAAWAMLPSPRTGHSC